MQDMKSLNEQLVNVRLDIRELSTKVDALADVKKEVLKVSKTADEALDKAESAHHRLNRLDKIIYWAGTTIIGTTLVALLSLLWSSGEH